MNNNKICINCGNILSDTAKFCSGCGCSVIQINQKTNIEQLVKCNNCGKEIINSGAKYCNNCGVNIEKTNDSTTEIIKNKSNQEQKKKLRQVIAIIAVIFVLLLGIVGLNKSTGSSIPEKAWDKVKVDLEEDVKDDVRRYYSGEYKSIKYHNINYAYITDSRYCGEEYSSIIEFEISYTVKYKDVYNEVQEEKITEYYSVTMPGTTVDGWGTYDPGYYDELKYLIENQNYSGKVGKISTMFQ